MGDYVIEADRLTKWYDGNVGCRDISLKVPRGVVFGFLGPNGAGKSTFVRTLLGLIRPTSGTGSILGQPIPSVFSRDKVGYLPELFRYPDWMTGKQLLKLHADLCGVSRAGRTKIIHNLLERVGLHQRGDEKIRGYSKGMQQRIGLACALLGDPEVLFLDEPTSALDPIGRKEVRELVSTLQDEGKTVFLNSHLLSEVESVCNHVAIIDKGRLVVQGDWRKLSAVKTEVEVTISGVTDRFWEASQGLVLNREQLDQWEGKSSWRVTLSDDQQIPALVSELTAHKLEVYQVTPKKQNLEDIFMYWITRKENVSDVDHR
ncbi:ABC transporter ATP-binding protein [Salinithrix halophila]|uniref:ABC transporter ATP-binding protein n=1 Tax=Salinithrix halophila TaxID=1485204 RepID=A0ABV8JKN3_9BACL